MRRLLFLLAGFGLATSAGYADAIVVTQAMTASTICEIFVEESSIRVELEIGGQDLPGFRNLMPDAVYERLGFEPAPLRERYPRFFREDLVIRADDGPPLVGLVREMEPRPKVNRDLITGEPLTAEEGEAETVIWAVLEYPLESRPETLTIASPTTEAGAPNSTIGFVLYHRGLPTTDFRYMAFEQTVDLDWEDPWYSRFRSRNLRRQYDSPISVFLYIEPYEVRVEVVSRPADVQKWTDLGLGDSETIPVGVQFELKQLIAEFLLTQLNLQIDGESVTPELDRVNFLRRTLRTSTVIDPPEPLDVISATLGTIWVVPTEGLPQEASVTWNRFSPKIQKIPAAATDEAGPLRFFLAEDDNVLWWKNFLKNPTLPTLVEVEPPPGVFARFAGWLSWLAAAGFLVAGVLQLRGSLRRSTAARGWVLVVVLALATAGLYWVSRPAQLNEDRATKVVGALLHNVYRAFDFRAEETIYDTLEQSVTGDLLTQTYLETRRGLELASQGGARAKVKEIELISVEPRSLDGGQGFVANCKWSVSGAVGHWGHVHTRVNQYEAELRVEPVEGVWKVTEMHVLQEERL